MNIESTCNQKHGNDLVMETYTVGITNTLVGLIVYIFFVVPILTFTIVGAMNLGDNYGVAIAAALVITGLYITEKTADTNI